MLFAPVHIPLHPRATARAPKPAPARRGGLDVSTVPACLCGIRLVDPFDHAPQLRRLVEQIALLAVESVALTWAWRFFRPLLLREPV
jgi:hypothetical protein